MYRSSLRVATALGSEGARKAFTTEVTEDTEESQILELLISSVASLYPAENLLFRTRAASRPSPNAAGNPSIIAP